MKTSSVRQANRGKRRPVVYLAKATRAGKYNLATTTSDPGVCARRYLAAGYTQVTASQFKRLWQQTTLAIDYGVVA